MTDREQIQSSLKEAEVYQTQGLLNEAGRKYQDLLETVTADPELARDDGLISLVSGKIREVGDALGEIEDESETTELPGEVQDLIGRLFSFSDNADAAAVEGAMALATFGQYDKALAKFQELLDKEILPTHVAKNILQCHLSLGEHDAAISQFEDWVRQDTFSGKELHSLGGFLESNLEKNGIEAELPFLGNTYTGEETPSADTPAISEDDISEILSVKVILGDKPMENRIRDFDVEFQLGNSITINVKNSEKDLLNLMERGVHLSRIQCYSSYYFFNAKGIVAEKKAVAAGPKQGDYSIVLSLESP